MEGDLSTCEAIFDLTDVVGTFWELSVAPSHLHDLQLIR